MTLSKTSILAVVELILYIPLCPLAMYLAKRHGRHGILGYFYLNVACFLRPVSDIFTLVTNSNPSSTPSLTSVILGSIGLTPIILSIAGFVHELHHYLLTTSKEPAGRIKTIQIRLWVVQLNIHGLCIAAMALFIVGGIHAATGTTPAEITSALNLRKAGAIIIVMVTGGLFNYTLYLIRGYRGTVLLPGYGDLARGTLLAAACIAVRDIYTAVVVFESKEATASPGKESFAAQVLCVFLASLLTVLALVAAGWRSAVVVDEAVLRRSGRLSGAEERSGYIYHEVAGRYAEAK